MEETNDTQILKAQMMAYELALAMLGANASVEARRMAVAQIDVALENVSAPLAPHLRQMFLEQIGRIRSALMHGTQ